MVACPQEVERGAQEGGRDGVAAQPAQPHPEGEELGREMHYRVRPIVEWGKRWHVAVAKDQHGVGGE